MFRNGGVNFLRAEFLDALALKAEGAPIGKSGDDVCALLRVSRFTSAMNVGLWKHRLQKVLAEPFKALRCKCINRKGLIKSRYGCFSAVARRGE